MSGGVIPNQEAWSRVSATVKTVERMSNPPGQRRRWWPGKSSDGETYLALINGSQAMRTREDGCVPTDPTHADAVTISPGQVDHQRVRIYSYVEVGLVEECLDGAGVPLSVAVCDQDTTSNRRVVHESITNGRIGVLNYPSVGVKQKDKWAINLWEISGSQSGHGSTLHHGMPPLSEETCVESGQWYVGFTDINNSVYGELFDPESPGIATTDGDFVFQWIVQMHEMTDKNGALIKWFVSPWQHLGSCGIGVV